MLGRNNYSGVKGGNIMKKTILRILGGIILNILLVVFLTSCGGGGSSESSSNNKTATITGTVAGTVVVAVDENDKEIDRDTATGTPKTFTLTVPIGHYYRFYFIENDGTSDVKICPLYQGSINVFFINTPVIIDLGFVDTSTGIAIPTNNPLEQGAIDGGENTSVPYKLALAGTWEVNSLASGPGAPWWLRGPITVCSNGSVSGVLEEYESDPDVISAVVSISTDGIITCTDMSTYRGHMDAGKTVIVGTSNWTTGSPGTTEISIWTKKGDSYSLADLAGTWEVNSLASGPGAPWWERGPITIDSNSSFSGTLTQSDGSLDNVSGTLNITADGIITMTGNDEDLRCSMDAGKTVVVCTSTWTTGSPGTTEIKVITKR